MNAFDRVWLKQNITLVQQASVIFEDTLFANIAIGHIHPDSVSRADVIAACRLVDMDSVIFALPFGLETLVGGNSCPLSEGQRQRVVLARAYLRNPAVLILDEATSALDPSSRDVIVKSVRQWRQGKTTIIVTHDISQIDDNDYVNVFENGTLTEQGFRRNLRGNHGSAFATLLPKLDTVQQIPDINIISPISEKSFEKSPEDFRSQETQLLMPKPALSRLVICIVAAVATPAFALCLANLLAAMWSSGDKAAEGKRWALYLIAVAIVDGACTGTGRYLLEYTAQSWVDSLRAKAFRNILHQPKLWFQRAENSPGRLAESLDRNCEEMRNILGRFVPIIVMVFTMISVSVILAIATSWKLALVSLSPLPLVVASVKGFAIVSDGWEVKCNKGAEHSSAILTEVLSKLKTVRAFTLEQHFSSKYSKCTNDALRLGLKRALYSAPLFGLYQSMSYALTALVFYYGTTLLVQEENPDIAKTLRVMNLLLFSIGSATDLLSSMPQIAMALASASHIMAFTNLPLPKAVPPAHTSTTNPPPICCNSLNFAYPSRPHKLILKNISVSILPGNCTVVVGPSGCGKSTLLSLLLQLHVPTNDAPSALTFGGTPSNATNTQTLLCKTGYVSQTAFLFPVTISENIAYGLPRNSPLRNPANIHAAAKEAGIHTFITSLPEGYGTVVGEGGQELSGGQAQRVTIARALVRRPLLLVLDEPTSALDSGNSDAVRGAIADLVRAWRSERRDAAVVMATHDIDMMRIADHIVVMEGGTVVEQGLFEDLWFNGDAFRRLVGERGIGT
ncbi:ATP-dependent permease [Lecanicillium sp. MT-2017a]|nr:ATP-dependent permease [Lecanicillium sp. MT-2017a]